jgi:hypothetical protein
VKYSEIRRLISSGAVVECKSAVQKTKVIHKLHKIGFELGVFASNSHPNSVDMSFPYGGVNSAGDIDGYIKAHVAYRNLYVIHAHDVLTARDDMPRLRDLTGLLM